MGERIQTCGCEEEQEVLHKAGRDVRARGHTFYGVKSPRSSSSERNEAPTGRRGEHAWVIAMGNRRSTVRHAPGRRKGCESIRLR